MTSRTPVCIIYTDLDGTLLGQGGSLLRTYEGTPTTESLESVLALQEQNVMIVPVSGRNEQQLFEVARLLSLRDFIAELGSEIFFDLGKQTITISKEFIPSEIRFSGTVVEYLETKRIPQLIVEAFPGLIEPHEPWTRNRKHTFLFRGVIRQGQTSSLYEEVETFLHKKNHGWLTLLDNGVIKNRGLLLDKNAEVHAFHLLPRGVNKAVAVSRHLKKHPRAIAYAMGDSAVDLMMLNEVDTFFFFGSEDELEQAYTTAVKMFKLKSNIERKSPDLCKANGRDLVIVNAKGPQGFRISTEIILDRIKKSRVRI